MSTGSGRAAGSILTDQMKNQKGSVMLEFAFVITFMLVIFMATVTFSFLFADYYNVQKVAREGAREACITGNENRAKAKASEAGRLWGLDPDRMTLEFVKEGSARVTQTCIVHYSARPFNKTFPTLINQTPLKDFQLTAKATFGWWDFSN